jgi:hypothetical protein
MWELTRQGIEILDHGPFFPFIVFLSGRPIGAVPAFFNFSLVWGKEARGTSSSSCMKRMEDHAIGSFSFSELHY